MDESRHAAESILQPAVAPIGELELQLGDAGVLLRQGLGHGRAALRGEFRRGGLGAWLLLSVRLQGGDCAAELEVLELETLWSAERGTGAAAGSPACSSCAGRGTVEERPGDSGEEGRR